MDPNSESRLSQKQVTRALQERGYPVTRTTLANYATRRCGPPYTKIGKAQSYLWADVLSWIEERTVRDQRA